MEEHARTVEHDWFDDDRVLGIALLAIGALRVVLTLTEHGNLAQTNSRSRSSWSQSQFT